MTSDDPTDHWARVAMFLHVRAYAYESALPAT
jgi:hypothetical protein